MTILSSGTSPRVHWSGVKVTRTVDLGAPAISPPVFQSVTRKVTELARLSLHTNYNGPDTKRLRYWLHGPGFQTRQVQDFSLIQRSALKSTGLLFNGCRSSYPGVKWPGWREGEVNNSPPSSAGLRMCGVIPLLPLVCLHSVDRKYFYNIKFYTSNQKFLTCYMNRHTQQAQSVRTS